MRQETTYPTKFGNDISMTTLTENDCCPMWPQIWEIIEGPIPTSIDSSVWNQLDEQWNGSVDEVKGQIDEHFYELLAEQ